MTPQSSQRISSSPNVASTQLDNIEFRFKAASEALMGADPHAFQSACAELQQLVLDFSQTLRDPAFAAWQSGTGSQRLRLLAEAMQSLRQGLLRRTVMVEQSLQLLVPAMQQPTYANGAAPYGGRTRQSGRMAGFAA